MNAIAEIVVATFALLLLAATVVTFTKPSLAERLLNAMASSAKAHYTEQIVRLLVGASVVLASPLMWRSKLFWTVGWAIVVSSIALILAPWRWHFRFGERVRPIMIKHMKAYAIGVFLFGLLLLYGAAAGPNSGS